MRILLLNWRDIKNPSGGGAEILTHEIAKRWVAWGHSVTMITSRFATGKQEEVVDGVYILRRGSWWTVHAHAFFFYLLHGRSYDIVIDEVHWFPFFSAVYARGKTVLLACEVARNLFGVVYPFPLSLFWRGIEKLYVFLYWSVPTLAISPSTKDDLVAEGFDAKRITVIPMGLTAPRQLPHVVKEKDPTLIYLGRLNKLKGIEDALKAFQLIHAKLPKSTFWVLGEGDPQYEKKIKHLVDMLGITRAVRFWGRVSDVEKFRLLARAHVLLFPSFQEGWGLVVSEAGLVGTPTIGYTVSGLKDVLRDGKSGVLTDTNPASLASGALRVLADPRLFKKLQDGTRHMAKEQSWDTTARTALHVLKTI